MRDSSAAQSAEILRHGDLRSRHLIIACLTAQLQHRFDSLIYARRAQWVAPALKPAKSANGQLPLQPDFVFRRVTPALTSGSEPVGFQRERRDNRRKVVKS